jgi:hypothetical protein
MRIAKALAHFGANHSDDMAAELIDLAKKSTALLRRIHETPAAIASPAPQAAE